MSLGDLPQGIRKVWNMRWCFIRPWTEFVACRKIIKNTDIAWVLGRKSRQERHGKSGEGSFRTLLAFPTDVMLQFLLGFTLGDVVGMYMAQNNDVPNLGKKLEEIEKDLEAKEKPEFLMSTWHCILDPPIPSWGACLRHSHIQSCFPLWSQPLSVASDPKST